MRHLYVVFAIAVSVAALPGQPAPQASTLPAFEQSRSDLAPDPGARFGVLPNGVRTIVMANKEPKGRASLRLVVGAGSFNEKDDQEGLAHFLEHMAFKGSTHYPPGTLIERLQRMGMGFGADTNAETTENRTEYQLELPDTKAATLADGLQILADYAGGLLLLENQIDPERGVILSEKRDRDSVDYRTYVAEQKFTLPDTIIPNRMPIGLSDVIEKAQRDRFLDFYNAWYLPEKLTVIAVGDFDPAIIEAMIRTAFDGLTARAPARPDPDLGTVVTPLGLRVEFHPEPEAPATTVEIETVMPYTHEIDTAAVRLRHLKRDLAFAIVNRRLQILSRKEDAPFTEAEGGAVEEFNFFRVAEIDLNCKPENWQKALAAGEQELRRALTHGFQPAELAEAVANARNNLDQAVKGSSTRLSNKLAEGLADTVVDRLVFTSPEEDEALYGPALDKITVQDCQDAMRQAWAGPGRNLFVSGNLKLDEPEKAIRTAYETSSGQAVDPPTKMSVEAFPYADFGPAGGVASEKRIEDLGITEVVFANGVRLNLKKTDFEAQKVHVGIRVGSGLLEAPETNEPGIAQLAGRTFVSGGLGRMGFDELQRVLAGKPLGIDFKVGEDAFTLGGATDSGHVLLELQLLTAYLTDPGYRPEALWTARKAIPEDYRQLEHTPEGVIQTKIARMLAGGDPRFGMPAESDLMARTLEDVKAWLAPQLAKGPIEVAVAGDFDEKAIVDAIGRTLGALPRRDWGVNAENLPLRGNAAERQVAFPSNPSDNHYTVQTEIPRGLVMLVWPTTDGLHIAEDRRLNILASIFSDRLRIKIRNEMSGAYSPEAENGGSTVFPGYGSMTAYLTVDPPMAEKIAKAVLEIADGLKKGGVTPDELERAKNPILTDIKQSERMNAYWLGSVLSMPQEDPERLDWARTRYDDYGKISKADVDTLAARYLDPARAFKFVVLPDNATQPANPPAK